MANPLPSIEKVVAEAFALMRRRLKAPQGIEVTHVIVAVTPDGTGIIRSNVPGALTELLELADMLKAIGDPRGGSFADSESRH